MSCKVQLSLVKIVLSSFLVSHKLWWLCRRMLRQIIFKIAQRKNILPRASHVDWQREIVFPRWKVTQNWAKLEKIILNIIKAKWQATNNIFKSFAFSRSTLTLLDFKEPNYIMKMIQKILISSSKIRLCNTYIQAKIERVRSKANPLQHFLYVHFSPSSSSAFNWISSRKTKLNQFYFFPSWSIKVLETSEWKRNSIYIHTMAMSIRREKDAKTFFLSKVKSRFVHMKSQQKSQKVFNKSITLSFFRVILSTNSRIKL